MALTDGQRDRLLIQMAADIRAIRRVLCPEDERPAATRKRDPKKLYADSSAPTP